MAAATPDVRKAGRSLFGSPGKAYLPKTLAKWRSSLVSGRVVISEAFKTVLSYGKFAPNTVPYLGIVFP
ncbi:MAG TPA: hypothetical protein VGM32_10315 [Rhodopila sp.]|jgi:hypothetical protein